MAPDRLLTATLHGSDSLTGGKLGPEASLLVLPVILALFLAFRYIYCGPAKQSKYNPPVVKSPSPD
jgi:hypothetical protein